MSSLLSFKFRIQYVEHIVALAKARSAPLKFDIASFPLVIVIAAPANPRARDTASLKVSLCFNTIDCKASIIGRV